MQQVVMRGAIPVLLVLLLVSSFAFAATTGKIAGRVTDDQGNPIISANVVIEGAQRGASTDLDGYYYVIGVRPGTYTVTASYIGYQTVSKTGVRVKLDQTVEVNFDLAESAVELEEAVIVVERERDIQPDQTATRKNVSSEEIELLPAETVGDVLRLQSGVVDAGGLHVRGGRADELAYLIDGHRVEDPLFGGGVADVNTAAIEQMELLTGTFNAEYGNAMSGVVNIVTREDAEEFKGSVRYKRSQLGIEEDSDNLNDNYLEASLSGPLPISGAGFLFSGRITRRDNYYESGVLETSGESVPVVTYTDSGDPFGYRDSNNFFAKLFGKPTDNSRLAVSYNYDGREWMNYSHDYKFIPDSAYVREDLSQVATLTFSHNLSQSFFYDVRASYNSYFYQKDYAGFSPEEYSSGNGARYNGEFLLGSRNQEWFEQNTGTFNSRIDASWQANRHHLLKSGLDFTYHDLAYDYIYGPTRPPEQQYINDYDEQPIEGAVYLQDKIEFETLIVNAGLRFDVYNPQIDGFVPVDDPSSSEQIDSDWKTQFSPRLGIAYPISDRMVFHLAYGHFFQRPSFEVMYEDLNRTLTVRSPLIGDPNIEPQKTVSYELGLDTEFFPGFTLQSTVFSKKITNLVGVVWEPQGPGNPVSYAYYTNEDFAYVRGFELNGRLRRGVVSVGANYTFSIAEGSSSSQMQRYSILPEVASNQSLQFYPLGFDQRHVGNAYISANFQDEQGPWGCAPAVFQNMTATFLVQATSGLPFTYNPSRKRYEPNLNNARMDAVWTADLEIEKRFPLGGFEPYVFIEVYDLFDVDNVTSVYSATGEPDDAGPDAFDLSYDYVNDPLNYDNPRTIYLGAGLRF